LEVSKWEQFLSGGSETGGLRQVGPETGGVKHNIFWMYQEGINLVR